MRLVLRLYNKRAIILFIASLAIISAILLFNLGCQETPATPDNSTLTVSIDKPQPKAGVDYSITPLTVTGKVSDHEATVTVNGILAEVSEDGRFSARIQLKGNNGVITVVATLGDEVYKVKAVFISDPEAIPEVP